MHKYAFNAKTNIEPKQTIESSYLIENVKIKNHIKKKKLPTSLDTCTTCKPFYRITLQTNLLPCFTETNNGSIAGTQTCKIPMLFVENNFAFFFDLPAPCIWHSVALCCDKKEGVAVEENNFF